MRSHRRRLPLDHVLIVGDATDLDGIATALAWLPADAYGQVVVEAAADVDLSALAAPLRVTVQRVEPLTAGPGLAAGAALAAWVGEWMPDEPDARRAVSIRVGDGVDVSRHELLGLVEGLWTVGQATGTL